MLISGSLAIWVEGWSGACDGFLLTNLMFSILVDFSIFSVHIWGTILLCFYIGGIIVKNLVDISVVRYIGDHCRRSLQSLIE